MERPRHLDGIQLVSIDIWSTLLKSNPLYKAGRAEALRSHLGAQSVDIDEFIALMKKIDDECDEVTEQTGEQFGLTERVRKIYEALPAVQRISELTDLVIFEFDQTALEVLLSNLPKVIEEDLLETLSRIDKLGIKMAVMSNTGFIDGRHMRVVLERLGILPFMSLQIFSNEVGAAKPSKLIFQALVEKSGIGGGYILHVGDNLKADYEGAVAAGLKALYLTNEDEEREGKIAALRDLIYE